MLAGVALEKIKQFETLIKKCLVARFGKYLPTNAIAIMYSKVYATKENLENIDTLEKGQGKVLRDLLGNIIHVTCEKTLKVNESEAENIIYGEDMNRALIEYYAKEIAEMYGYYIDEKPELKDDLDTVLMIKEKLGDGLDSMALNSNAIQILSAADMKELIEKSDNKAIEDYVAKKESVNAQAVGSKEEEKQIKKDLSNNGRMQIIYLNGKQYIKYTDKFDTVHLVETNNSKIISDVYRDKFNNLKPGEEIDLEEFFKDLTKIVEEEKLTPVKDIDQDNLTSEEVNMIEFVHGNEELKQVTDTDVVTVSKDSNIHVMEETNDVVATSVAGGVVTSEVVKDASLDPKKTGDEVPLENQKQENVNEHELTEEEYVALCEKFASNKELTIDELRALKASTLNKEIEEETGLVQQEEGPKLKMSSSDYKMAGFANKYLPFIIIGITICIGVITGSLLFKLLK